MSPYSIPFQNMTASAEANFYSALDARIFGLLAVALVAGVIVVLASSRLFDKFRKSGRFLLRGLYYIGLGIPIYLGGFTLYKVGYWIGEMMALSTVRPVDIAKWTVYTIALGVLGYMGEFAGKKIAANIARVRNEKAADEEAGA